MFNTLLDILEATAILLNVYFTPVLLSSESNAEQTPESQPTYDFVVPWARDPTHTSLCIAAGAAVVVMSGSVLRMGGGVRVSRVPVQISRLTHNAMHSSTTTKYSYTLHQFVHSSQRFN